MSVDKGIFRRHRRNQPETFDFHSGVHGNPHWKSDEAIDRYVPTHCCYCGVQCGMYLKVANGKVVGVEPREDFPLNHGMLCPKGATAYQTVNNPDRLTYPLMRRGGKDSPLVPGKGLVAYSNVCTHLSCAVVYEGDGKLHCPCHEGLFDATTGNVLAGPPIRPLPRIQLAISNGTIYAVKEVLR